MACGRAAVVFVTFFERIKLGTVRVPDFLKAKDKKQIAAFYGLLATAPWDTSLVQRDVLRIISGLSTSGENSPNEGEGCI